jgi:CubicO group peptidase (beta-lactamase class C family)
MKPENIFHWASVSKTFVATAILQLMEQGKINLDEKIVTYVPYFQQKEQWYKDISIRQMLNHTSGIGDVEDYEWDKPQNDEGAPERFVRRLKNDKMRFAPGKDWAYSNTAYEILGVVITRVSGTPFEAYIKKNILEPLEMEQTSFVYPEIPDSLRVKGHVWAAEPIVSKVYPYNRIHAPSSTLNSNVTEMTHYAMANLHRGQYHDKRILSDSSYNLLWTNSVNLPGKPQIGASWFLEDHKGMKIVSHSGGDTGFRSHLLLVPEKNISVMVACNYELGRTEDIGFAVLDLLLGNKPEEIKRQIGFAFAERLKKEGLANASDFYHMIKEDSTAAKNYIWEEDEGAFVYPGYLLMEQNMNKEAIEVFKLNLEQFPSSAWAHAHLGIGHARANEKKLAKENLLKAIELNPDEPYFKEELKKTGN